MGGVFVFHDDQFSGEVLNEPMLLGDSLDHLQTESIGRSHVAHEGARLVSELYISDESD